MKSEFAALEDLAIGSGIAHSDLLTAIQTAVLEDFRAGFPKSPADATVFVNENSGDVRIFSGDKDITPPDFGPRAAQVARQTIISRLADNKNAPETSRMSTKTTAKAPTFSLAAIGNLFFWGYNIYFLLFNLVLAVSFLRGGPGIWISELAEAGVIKVLTAVGLLSIPVLTMFLTIKKKWYSNPARLLKIFFVFELPLAVICMLPVMMSSTTTPFGMLLTLLLMTIPGVFYIYNSEIKLPVWGWKIVYFVNQFVFFAGAYLAFLYTFFVPLVLTSLVRYFFGSWNIFSMTYSYSYSSNLPGTFLQMGIGLLIILLVAAVMLGPYMILITLWRAMRKSQAKLTIFIPNQIRATDSIMAAGILVICAATAYQPTGGKLIDNLRQISKVQTFSEKEVLAKTITANKDLVKKLITGQETARRKYWMTKDSTTIKRGYEDMFDVDELTADVLQRIYTTAAYPFVYQGENRDYYQLQTNYYYVFGEYASSNSTSSTTRPTIAKNVLMTYRKVEVVPETGGKLAKVTIEEEYENQTFSQQEVIYEFSLPKGAVMTDLKLGPDLEYTGVIAPKGAAQKTYEQQLQIRRDPALLEQTGPNQYRLRVFPVPGKNDYTTLKGRRQKVSWTYATAATPQGYPLPEITKSTNVFTNAASNIYYTTSQGKVTLAQQATTIPFVGGAVPDLCTSQETAACWTDADVWNNLRGANIAIFYDVSANSRPDENLDKLTTILKENRNGLENNTVDLYKYNELPGEKVTLKPANLDEEINITRFGKSTGLTAISGFNQKYDAVFLVGLGNTQITDKLPFAFPTRIYVVNTQAPVLGMKATSQIVQTGGAAVKSLTDGVRLFEEEKQSQPGEYVLSRYVKLEGLLPTAGQISSPVESRTAAGALTNLGLLQSALTTYNTDVSGDISILDQANNFAVKANIVTPYSSLLALVNEQQQLTLQQLEQNYNRYQDTQMVTQNQNVVSPMPRMLENVGPMFDTLGPSVMFGAPKGGASSVGGGGGGSFGAMANPYLASNQYESISQFSLPAAPLFIVFNGVILGIGLLVYMVKTLKRKH